jgi:adenylate kinase family enzyme
MLYKPFGLLPLMYNHILIIGATGSGKTTLAKRLSSILSTPQKSTDDFQYTNHFQTKFSEKERDSKLKKFLQNKKWIIDGVQAKPWVYPIFKKAEIIIMLRTNRIKLIYRLIKRFLEEKKKKKDKELRDLIKLLYWSQMYKFDNYKKHIKLASKFNKKIIFLDNGKEIENFIHSISI